MAKHIPVPSSRVLSRENPTLRPHPKAIAALAELMEDFAQEFMGFFEFPPLFASRSTMGHE